MKKIALWNPRPIVGRSFKGCKKHVLPSQSMTLQEILRRFVKRESLPAAKQGVYYDGDYDLEKLAHADITEKHEVLEEVKKDVAVKHARAKKAAEPPKVPDSPVNPPEAVPPKQP